MSGINKILVGIWLMLPIIIVNGQFDSHSPYSRFGLGDISRTGFSHNRALGGISVGLRSKNSINYLNPASYSSQDTISFIFDFGLSANFTELESSEYKEQTSNINMDHLAISFPVSRFWKTSLGITPFSKVRYNMIIEENQDESTSQYSILYDGSGGINQFYFGNSVLIGNHVALGLNISYLFGTIEQLRTVRLTNQSYQAVTYFNDKLNLGDFYLDYGLQLFSDINERSKVTLGFTLSSKTKINAKYDSLVIREIFGYALDTLKYVNYSDGNILFPGRIGAGFTYEYNNKLLIGFDYISQNWSKALFFDRNYELENSSSLRFGMQYIPISLTDIRKGKYWQRIKYRLGGYYNRSYIKINGNQIIDRGVSIGLGLPWKNEKNLYTNTYFNIAYKLGQRGSVDNGLIKETYHLLSIDLNLYDFWFLKPKYD
jgi:hypothetical protein